MAENDQRWSSEGKKASTRCACPNECMPARLQQQQDADAHKGGLHDGSLASKEQTDTPIEAVPQCAASTGLGPEAGRKSCQMVRGCSRLSDVSVLWNVEWSRW